MATSKKQRCKKGNVFPCKTRCVPRYHWKTGKEQECRNVATGTPKNFLEWAKSQGAKKKAINIQRRAEGKSLVRSDKAGYLVEKDGRYYEEKASKARKIASKTKDPKIQKQALEVADKFDKMASKASPSKEQKPTQQAPTLKAREYNPHAIKDLSLDDFREYWYKGRSMLASQKDPNAVHNTPYTKEYGTRKKYLGDLENAISIGFVPSSDVIESVKLTNKQKAKIEANQAELSQLQSQSDQLEKAIAYPLVSSDEISRHATTMPRESAEAFLTSSPP